MLRAVRRCCATVLLLVLVSACGGAGEPAPYDATGIDGLVVPSPSPDPADFVEGVDNPWLSWEAGTTRRYVVTEGGREVGTWVVDVDGATEQVAGIAATVVRSRLQVGSQEAQETVDHVAQDTRGNVWWLGHESGTDSWQVGAGVPAGLVLPASPRPADGWVSAVAPAGRVITRVLGRTVVEEWDDALETMVESDTDERRYYVSGVGLVRVVDMATGRSYDLAD